MNEEKYFCLKCGSSHIHIWHTSKEIRTECQADGCGHVSTKPIEVLTFEQYAARCCAKKA